MAELQATLGQLSKDLCELNVQFQQMLLKLFDDGRLLLQALAQIPDVTLRTRMWIVIQPQITHDKNSQKMSPESLA
jgi:hypothetical protein